MTRPEQVAHLLMSGLSVEEAAQRLGIKIKAVQTNVVRARARGFLPPVQSKATPVEKLRIYVNQKLGLQFGHITPALVNQPQEFIDFLIDNQRGNETIAYVLVKLAVDAKARRGYRQPTI